MLDAVAALGYSTELTHHLFRECWWWEPAATLLRAGVIMPTPPVDTSRTGRSPRETPLIGGPKSCPLDPPSDYKAVGQGRPALKGPSMAVSPGGVALTACDRGSISRWYGRG